MEIQYCDKCKARIPEADVSMGSVFMSPEGNLYCRSCWRQIQKLGQGPAGPAAPLSVAEPEAPEVIDIEVAETEVVGVEEAEADVTELEDDEVALAARQAKVPERARGGPPRRDALPRERAGTRAHPRIRRSERAARISAVGRRTPPGKRSALWPALGGLVVGLVVVVFVVPRYLLGEDAGDRADAEGPKPPTAAPAGTESDSGQAPRPVEEPPGEPPAEPVKEEPATMEEAAKKKFDEIAALVEAGELGRAEDLFEAGRADLVATEYEGKAEALLLAAKVKLAIAESGKLAAEVKYDEALMLVEKALSSVVGSRHADTLKDLDRLKALRDGYRKAVEEVAAKKRREEAERLRRQKWDELVASAKRKAGEGEFEAALDILAEAQRLFDNEEVRAEISSVTFDMHVLTGREHAEAGRHALAIEAFEKALEAKRDADLEEEVARLRSLQKFNELCALAEKRVGRGDSKGAIDAYREAKKAAPDDEAARKVDSAIRDLQFAAALAEAERDLRARRWRKAESAALWAIELRPASSRAREILARARRGLAPPKRRLRNRAGIDLVLVQGGVFTMGSDDGPRDARPAREVKLDSYYIGVTEVTNDQYELFDPDHRKRRGKHSPGDNHPVTKVTQEQAVEFCRWLSKKDKATCRLPTEAEWERAARGRDGRRYPWGDGGPASGGVFRCNFGMRARKGWGRDGFVLAAPVGSFPDWESPVGCLDMAGNVAEWCLTAADDKAVTRGGSWQSAAPQVAATARSSLKRGRAAATVGFRVVREVEAAAP